MQNRSQHHAYRTGRCAVSHPCTQPLARCGSFQRLESEMNTGVCPGRKNHKVDHQENRQNSSQRGQCPAPARFAEQYKQHCDRKAANDNGCCRPFGKTHKCKTAQKNRQIHPTHIKASAGHFCKQDHKNRNKNSRCSLRIHVRNEVHHICIAETACSVCQSCPQAGAVEQKHGEGEQ